jgi:Na+(H+)/acetate symporter ActP
VGDTPRLGASFVDYLLVVVYLAVVLLIGVAARRRVPDSLDFFLSGRSLPALVTGLAFISANQGAVGPAGRLVSRGKTRRACSLGCGSRLRRRRQRTHDR